VADFSPALPAASTRAPYAPGAAGIRMSLETMAQKMREGRLDPGIRGWALGALRDAGIDGRGRQSVRSQASALLEAFRKVTVYAPDPYGAEYIPSAAATLCLKPNLCVNGDDCDGLSVALGSLMLSIGIPTMIVKQNFGSDQQEHVLIAIHDGTDWLYADPSTRMPLGSAVNAVSEVWVDPMDPVGSLPEATPEIVTLGRPKGLGRRSTRVSPAPHWLGLGSGIVTPGDVLAYRAIWDPYVMGTARAGLVCAAAWQAVIDGKPPSTPINLGKFAVPPDAKTLQLQVQLQQQWGAGLVVSWNQYANLQDWEIVVSAGDILQAFQETVKQTGAFNQPQIRHDCPSLVLPDPPGIEAQQRVIAQIEGLGILEHGIMQLFAKGAGGALETYETIGQKLTDPTTLGIGSVGIVVGVVATMVGIYTLNRLIPARR
jgi:hypothetical protein